MRPIVQVVMRHCRQFSQWKGVIVGKVQHVQAHPMADKLKLCQVQLNATEQVQIICGAPNVAQGQHVPVATIGTRLNGGGPDEKKIKIKRSKLRGEVSLGMICSAGELGLQPRDQDAGILVLDDAESTVGDPFDEYYLKTKAPEL